LVEGGRTKVRYKRANLIVDQWVSVFLSPVGVTLTARREGRATDEDVARAFLKEQVVGHTESFDWETVELDVLLPRVAGLMQKPEVKARTPQGLVPELEAIRDEEKERWEKVHERIRQQIPEISRTVMKNVPRLKAPPISKQVRETILKGERMRMASVTYPSGMTKTIQTITPTLNLYKNLWLDWAKINETILREVRLSDIGIDPSTYGGLFKLHGPLKVDWAELAGQGHPFPDNWELIVKEVTSAARKAGAADLADVADETAGEAAKDAQEIDLAPLFEDLERLSAEVQKISEQNGELAEQVNRLSRKNSISRAIIASLIAGMILLVIQYVLAVKFGILLTPPEDNP